jgi:hypothetical protein
MFFFSQGFLRADFFLLKNGNVLEGSVKSETEEEYEVVIVGGSTRIKKNAVLKIEKNSGLLTPRVEFEQKKKHAESLEALIAAAEFGIQNGFDVEALSLLRRAWIQGNRLDNALKARIQNFEEKYLSEISIKAQIFFNALKYRSCALLLNQTLKQDFLTEPFSLVELKKQAYSHLESEQVSREILTKTLEAQKKYSLVVDKEASKKNGSRARDKNDTLSPAQEFKEQQKKLDPVYSQIVVSITELFTLQGFIEKENYGILACQELHTVKMLDQARGDLKTFNRVRGENNKIYQARKFCRQYNYLLDAAQAQMRRVSAVLQNENEIWIAQGFEKMNGLWLQGDEINKAKGMELYHGEWIDPKDTDYYKKKEALDKKQGLSTPTLETKNLEESSPSSPSLSPKIHEEDLFKIEEHSAKKLLTNIKTTLREEVNQAVTQKVEDTKGHIKSFQNTAQEIIEEKAEESKGLSLPLGIGLILGIWFVLKISKRKK